MASYWTPSQSKPVPVKDVPYPHILLILTVEPFLRCIWDNVDIKGIHIAGKHYKIADFADDILPFLTKLLISIPKLLKDFGLFQYIEHFKIYFSKSKAFNISFPTSQIAICKKNFPFTWQNDAITYLGIQLTTRLSDLYNKNYMPILQSIKDYLKKWCKPNFSWLGRVSIIKMNVFPCVLYVLQTIPIALPLAFIQTIKKVCTQFLWNNKKWESITLISLCPNSRVA